MFSVRNVSTSRVPAAARDIWAVLTDPVQLADATPILHSIDVSGERWIWKLRPIEALGLKLEAEFTELMHFVEQQSIRFEHAPPPAVHERVGVDGTYHLTPTTDDVTDLRIDLTLTVDVPLPRVAALPVERAVRSTMRATGHRFAENLYGLLGLDPATVDVHEVEV